MNMKKYYKMIIVASMALLFSVSTAYAANNFSFSFVSNVIGKTVFDLKAKNTVCVSKAATYVYNTNNYAKFVGNYRISLKGTGLLGHTYKGDYKKADDKEHTTKYDVIAKHTYTVNIGTNTDLAAQCGQIKGTGHIEQ